MINENERIKCGRNTLPVSNSVQVVYKFYDLSQKSLEEVSE